MYTDTRQSTLKHTVTMLKHNITLRQNPNTLHNFLHTSILTVTLCELISYLESAAMKVLSSNSDKIFNTN